MEEALLLVLKVTLLHGCFSGFLNCTNGIKSRNASHLVLLRGNYFYFKGNDALLISSFLISYLVVPIGNSPNFEFHDKVKLQLLEDSSKVIEKKI